MYVDGFVLPVPEKNLKAYRAIAQKAGKIWRFSAVAFKTSPTKTNTIKCS